MYEHPIPINIFIVCVVLQAVERCIRLRGVGGDNEIHRGTVESLSIRNLVCIKLEITV